MIALCAAAGGALIAEAQHASSGQSPSAMMHAAMTKPMPQMKMTGDIDKDFAMMMAQHHVSAIEMAKIEIKYGKSSEMKGMAKKMLDAQVKERAKLLKFAKG